MQIFPSSLPTFSANSGTNVGSQVNREVTVGSNDTATTGSWASILSPSYLVGGLQNASSYLPSTLRSTSVEKTVVAPKQPSPSDSDFSDEAKKHEEIPQDFVPHLLQNADTNFGSTEFTNVTAATNDIVNTTATFRNSIQGALDARHITLGTLTQELETIFASIVHKLKSIPHPDRVPGHAERKEMVDKILDDAAAPLTALAIRYGIKVEVVTTYLRTLRPQLHSLIVAVGDINERHPQIFSMLMFSVTAMLIPESWILKPFLSLFGFGPAGPIKGSAAAWMQRYFWGAAVKAGSWFSVLQAAGMGVVPAWAGVAVKVPLAIGGGLLGRFFPSKRTE